MRLFKGKRNEEEDNDIEESRFVTLRDLKKENRKKRDTPLKPWGKKERVLVSIIFGLTVVVSIALAFSARQGKVPGLPRITSPNLGLSETIIVENKTPTPVQKEKAQLITENFTNITKSLSGIYSFYLIDLKTGNSFGVNQNEIMQAASLIKLPVIVSAYKEYEAGRFALDTKYSLKNSDKISGSGSIIGKPEGTTFTYRELLSYMGQQSDNTAFNVVRKKIGDPTIKSYISQIGLVNTSLLENTTTPFEIATVFRKLYDGSLVTKKNSDEIFKSLTKTIYENYLPVGVPDNVVVAHKYGREVHVINDAGIVYGRTPYVVVIMTGGVVESEAEKVFGDLSRVIYEGMEN